jgi:hypothetical protein
MVCEWCGSEFSYRQGLHRHIKDRCKIKRDKDAKIKELEEKIKIISKEKDKLLDTVQNNSVTAKKSMSTLNYVMKNMNDAPPVKLLEGEELSGMISYDKKTDRSIEDLLIHFYDKNLLHEFLGNMIINVYKKDDPTEQSFWSSDVSRLTFVIKQIVGEPDDSEWVTDKKGTKLTKMIICPVTDEVKNILQEYIKKCGKIVRKINVCDTEEELSGKTTLSNMQKCNEIIMKINLKTIEKEVLRYLAPYFNLNISKK